MKYLVASILLGVGIVIGVGLSRENKPTEVTLPPTEIPKVTLVQIADHTYVLGFYEHKDGIALEHYAGCTNLHHIID